jgi:hypothetical protein
MKSIHVVAETSYVLATRTVTLLNSATMERVDHKFLVPENRHGQ